jgi:FKBP-type peptidyl-prolyl cis-trans isomerase SlyD
MKVEKDKIVSIHYTLRDESGDVIDSSTDGDPLDFIQGAGQIIPGVEKALEGKTSGEEMTVVVEPEEGYGLRDESLVYKVPKEQFKDMGNIEVGMRFQVNAGDGPVLMNVASVEPDGVVLDGNHPLADMRLAFDVSIVNVREATKEELEGSTHGSECDCC